MFPLAVVQVSANGAPATKFGKVPLFVTDTVAVFVHPLAGLVTVTVYVPAAFTVGDEVVPPETIPAPAHE